MPFGQSVDDALAQPVRDRPVVGLRPQVCAGDDEQQPLERERPAGVPGDGAVGILEVGDGGPP